MKGDDLSERLIQFAVRILRLTQALSRTYVGRHVGNQLVRAGTAIGANYEEARGGESRADFIHKLGIAWKESREAAYWLKIVHRAQIVKPVLVQGLVDEAQQLSAILATCIKTARKRRSDDD